MGDKDDRARVELITLVEAIGFYDGLSVVLSVVRQFFKLDNLSLPKTLDLSSSSALILWFFGRFDGVTMVMESGGEVKARGEFDVPFVPRHATREGWVTFEQDPRTAQLKARVRGYQRP